MTDPRVRELVRRPPGRFQRPSPFAFALLVGVGALLIHGWTTGARIDPTKFLTGSQRLGQFLQQAFPPDLTRIEAIGKALLVTFEMALLGTIVGAILSLPLGLMAARNTTPHRLVYGATRGFISICRTIPDMVWGLIFVIAVGLGPEAGVLALTVDAMGFCGRFFAEAIEEIDQGAMTALKANGAPRRAVIMGGVLPNAAPSFVATSMFCLEQATRSSVVLGLVGAGGIGIELSVSMTLLRYDEAMTIILTIFVIVLAVERTSAAIRRRILGEAA